jgi:Flp pilus assembly protein TadD
MAIPIEGTTVVVRCAQITPLIEAGRIVAPNNTCLQDDHLWRCSFMEDREAHVFLHILGREGLNVTQGPDPDAVVVTEYDQKTQPYCEWLAFGTWDKAVIAWLVGTQPERVVAREGWDPSVGSGLNRMSEEELKRDFVHESTKDGVEAYVHRETGKRIYLGRSQLSPERMFKEASAIVSKFAFDVGLEPLTGSAATEMLEAERKLETLVNDSPNWWAAWWMLGKARQRRGRLEAGREAYRKAAEASGNHITCLRELGGICLELGDFAEAVDVATRAVVIEPDNHELIGNQAISFLLADRISEAAKAIDTAVRLNPQDTVNRNVEILIRQVVAGERERPRTLQEAMRPPTRKRKLKKMDPDMKQEQRPWWKFW